MNDGSIPQPNFQTASTMDVKRYFQACAQNADEQGMKMAADELKRRNEHEYLNYKREELGPDIGTLF